MTYVPVMRLLCPKKKALQRTANIKRVNSPAVAQPKNKDEKNLLNLFP